MVLLVGMGMGDICMEGVGFVGELVMVEQIDGMFEYLEQGLVEIGFLDFVQLKKLMLCLWWLFVCMQLEIEEVNILWGIVKCMLGCCVIVIMLFIGVVDDCC